MLEDNIKMGDRIEIYQKDRKASSKFYVSKVEQVLDKDKLVVHVPISYGNLIKLPPDTIYSFLFFTDKGMLRLDAVIKEYFVEDGFYMMNVQMQTAAQKFQRREFFRFECSLHINIGVVDDSYDIATDTPRPAMFDCVAKDISAGGVRFATNTDMDVNAKVKCVMPLGGDTFLTLGKVLQKQEFKQSEYKYQYRVMFLDLTTMEKEKIVKYIFVEQRKALRNRK